MPYFPPGAAAGSLTGATLASNVLASSLTSTGTLTALTTSGTLVTSNTTDSSSTTTGALQTLGGLGVAKKAFLGTGLDVAVVDANATAVLLHGTSKAIRMHAETTGFVIEGVDNTGVGSFQPLTIGGSLVTFTANTKISSGGTLTLGNAATTGLTAGVLAALTNASIVLTDSGGQAYRIPCII